MNDRNDSRSAPDSGPEPGRTPRSRLLARLFDIRAIIAALLGIYGVLLLIAGVAPDLARAGAADRPRPDDAVDLAAGSGANVWVGVVLLVVAALFAGWAALRPHD